MDESVNEYGCPLHACWGYRHDAHYWAWLSHRIDTATPGSPDWCYRVMREKAQA